MYIINERDQLYVYTLIAADVSCAIKYFGCIPHTLDKFKAQCVPSVILTYRGPEYLGQREPVNVGTL